MVSNKEKALANNGQTVKTLPYVTGKRGNVEINNSPQAGIEPGASRFNIQHSTE